MSFALLVTLTVIEILALVLVLAAYLAAVARGLNSISATLAKVAFGVRAVERQVTIGPTVGELNQALAHLADQTLPRALAAAERVRDAQVAPPPRPASSRKRKVLS
jgi:hypothetical protein